MSDTTPSECPLDADHGLTVECAKGRQVVNIALRGEGDISTLEQLDFALDHVDLNGATAVHLDVNDLEFADLATIRRLAAFARQAQQTGLTITTCGASATLRRVAALLDAYDILGLD